MSKRPTTIVDREVDLDNSLSLFATFVISLTRSSFAAKKNWNDEREHQKLGHAYICNRSLLCLTTPHPNSYHLDTPHTPTTTHSPTMSSFFSSGNAQTNSDMQTKKEEVKQRIAQELAIANAQTLINVSRGRCSLVLWVAWIRVELMMVVAFRKLIQKINENASLGA